MIGLDVGGYRGECIERYAEYTGCTEIYSFEPHPKLFDKCQTVADRCLKKNPNLSIKVINKALYKDGEFELNLDDIESSLFTESSDKLKIESISFKTFLKENNIKDKIHRIKMNCEGAEFDILKDLIESNIVFDEILVQFHERDDERNHLIKQFLDRNYIVWGQYRSHDVWPVWFSIAQPNIKPQLVRGNKKLKRITNPYNKEEMKNPNPQSIIEIDPLFINL